MIISWIFCGILALSLLSAALNGNGTALASSVMQGAQNGVTLVISMAGSICLWCGIGKLMEKVGITSFLSHMLKPALHRIFPSTRKDTALTNSLSANICANFLGLGNAATPMGIQATKQLSKHSQAGYASNEICRLVVLNTASIQLIPATVAAVRSSLGCTTPFDILPAVWITSLCSASIGLLAAWGFGKLWKS